MNPPDTKTIHARYNQITGFNIPYTMMRHYYWERWLAKGYTAHDLELVVTYIKCRIRDKRREKESLLLRNLISNPDGFAEDLAMARAGKRVYHPTARDRILRSTGRESITQSSPRTAGQVMADSKAFNEFQRVVREELGL